MNHRLQKKCVFAAMGFHALMLLVVLFGSAFFSEKQRPDMGPLVEVVDLRNIIEGNVALGGAPDVKPPPPSTTPPDPNGKPVLPVPPPPQVKPPQPAPPTPEKNKPQPKDEVEDKPETTAPPTKDSFNVSKNQPRKVVIDSNSLKLQTRNNGKQKSKPNNAPAANNNSDSDSRNKANQDAVRSSLLVLKGTMSSSTKVGIPGPGNSDIIATGYDKLIQSVYQSRHNQEANAAGEMGTGNAEVDVAVTISRDGKVLSTRITSPSGNSAYNRMVQRVLDKVTFIGPFPASSSDSQRTFNITFELKPKKAD